MTDPTLAHQTNDALAYNFPVSGNGWNSGDLTTMAGGTGWHMTVDDVLKVMGTFRRAGTIMSPAQAQTMLEDSFGIDFITQTQLGTFYAKVGGWGAATAKFEQVRAVLPSPRTWSWWCSSTLPSARRTQSPCSRSSPTRTPATSSSSPPSLASRSASVSRRRPNNHSPP